MNRRPVKLKKIKLEVSDDIRLYRNYRGLLATLYHQISLYSPRPLKCYAGFAGDPKDRDLHGIVIGTKSLHKLIYNKKGQLYKLEDDNKTVLIYNITGYYIRLMPDPTCQAQS